MNLPSSIILGSSSPRRLELLQSLFPEKEISVLPPSNPDEQDLSSFTNKEEIKKGILTITKKKNDDVCNQVSSGSSSFILTADTGILVEKSPDTFQLLGKPSEENYREVVSHWFRNYYLGKKHEVITAVQLTCLPSSKSFSSLVSTEVTMHADLESHISWYLDTLEPLGKAGGYAIQGAGSFFVEQITGSLSNIIGLPIKETYQLFEQAEQELKGSTS